MMTRRLSSAPNHSPLKIYKIITFVFFIVTIFLLGLVIFMVSKKATIVVVAKEDVKDIQLKTTVSPQGGQNNFLTGVVTSTIFSWSKKYSSVGTKRVEGTAEGELVVYNKADTPITLIPKTRFITPEGALFRLKNYTAIPAFGEKVVQVYADKPGKGGDISPSHFTIPGLPTDRQKLTYAISTKAMTGGESEVEILSQDDFASAETLYKEDVKEEFFAQYSSLTPPGSKLLFTVADQSVTFDSEVGNEVSEFTVHGTSTFIIVYYNSDELNQLISREINSQIDTTVDKILPVLKDPVVSIASYDKDNQIAQLTAVQNIVLTIDANAEKLAPQRFLGMKKEEIEEYVLDLDHVAGVEIHFSPYWIRSAPDVSDKIKVTVKNIK